MSQAIPFALNPDLSVAVLAERFERAKRLQIRDFLDANSAAALHRSLRQREDWVHVLNSDAKVMEIPRAVKTGMSPAQNEALDNAIYAGARHGFQYRYESIRVSDDEHIRSRSDDPLFAFAHWLSSGEAREFLRAIIGSTIDFADAQATAYAPGDFLTGHDDEVSGKRRHAAYVFSLNPIWRTEWGGLLLFHDDDALVGFPPRFNSLNLFAVGQMHSVSEVTRAAAYRRYSITGWLRDR